MALTWRLEDIKMSRMGSSTLWGKIIVLVAVCGWGLSAQAKYNGGSGEPNNPYQISSVADWQELMTTPADWASHFVLTADIDLNDVPITPIGNLSQYFTGVFDGNEHVIRNADVNMPASDYVGLFGYLGKYGQIGNLGAEAISVFGRDTVGGLVGQSYYGAISSCYSTGSVSATGDYIGGLLGHNLIGGSVSNCYSTSSVIGDYYVGGLVGCNADARVVHGSIANCYSTGSVSGTGDYVGGLVGSNSGSIASSFWDVNTSGWTTSDGGTGKTTAQMQNINTFLESGWDFIRETTNGTCNFWLIPESGGYPVLSTFNGYIPPEPRGNGTEGDPYIITDANELGTVWYRPSAHYLLGNDIDLAGIKWSGAVIPFFSSIFDGNGHILRNMDVNAAGADCVGLFAYLRQDGQIKNLGVEQISIVGRNCTGVLVGVNYNSTISNSYAVGSVGATGYCAGGLAGVNSGNIINCWSTTSINGEGRNLGGLAGWNSGTISNCYSSGSVSGYEDVGGLVGYDSSGDISNCYSTSSVTGVTTNVGGLVGQSYYGAISNCYSTGLVKGTGFYVGGLLGRNRSGVTERGSFWDVNTSGRATSAGGTPKTTAEMKSMSTFTGAGWDFVGETGNGTEDIWAICEGTNYPRFVYQIPQGDIACPDGVNALDFSLLADYWLETNCAGLYHCGGADIDLSGRVDFGDFGALAESWLRGVE